MSSLLLGLPAARVHASGLTLPMLGPTNFGVSTTGPTSVHYNPAGLGYAKKVRILIGGNLLIGKLSYTRVRQGTYQNPDSLDFQLPIDPNAVDPTKTGADRTVEARPIGVVPAVFTEIPIGDLPVVAGFGIDAPYAAIVRWPGAGPQRFQLNDATLATVFVNAGLAYKVMDRLSLGVGAAYVLGYADLSRTQDLASVRDLGEALGRAPINQPNGFGPDADPALRELDTFARPFQFNNGWAHGVTFRAGLMAELVDNLWLSASYEHKTKLDFRGTFSLDMNDPFFTQDLASQGLKYPARVNGDASLSFVLPSVVRFGLRHAFGPKINGEPSTSVALEASYTRWSALKDFDVRIRSPELAQPELGLGNSMRIKLPRGWHDTYGGLLRGQVSTSEDLSLWLAVGAETAAVPDATIDAASPDGARITGSAGLSRALVGELRLILDLTFQQVLKREVVGSDYDLGNGTHKMWLLAGGAYADYRF